MKKKKKRKNARIVTIHRRNMKSGTVPAVEKTTVRIVTTCVPHVEIRCAESARTRQIPKKRSFGVIGAQDFDVPYVYRLTDPSSKHVVIAGFNTAGPLVGRWWNVWNATNTWAVDRVIVTGINNASRVTKRNGPPNNSKQVYIPIFSLRNVRTRFSIWLECTSTRKGKIKEKGLIIMTSAVEWLVVGARRVAVRCVARRPIFCP